MVKWHKYIQNCFSRRNLIFLLGLLTLFLSLILAHYPNFVTKYYTNGLYVFIAKSMSWYSSWFKFSLTDSAFVILIILFILALAAILFKRKNIKQISIVFTKLVVGIYIAFNWLWGFNYLGNNIYERNIISQIELSRTDFIETLDYLIAETNNTRVSFDNFDHMFVDSLIEDAFQKNANYLKINYPLGKRRTKNIILSRYYSGAGISGYFMPFFNETHLNKTLLPIQYPVVLAHEKSHQFGITSESEANFYAWYVCSQSESDQLKYSANLFMLRYFLQQINYNEIESELQNIINQEVMDDLQTVRNHWAALRIKSIDDFNGWLYNKYLKVNKIPDGIENYGGVVTMIIEQYKQSNSH